VSISGTGCRVNEQADAFRRRETTASIGALLARISGTVLVNSCPPPPLFSDLRIIKDFKSFVFGSADSEGVTGVFFGSADCKGVSGR
jgi:hypothetical protein